MEMLINQLRKFQISLMGQRVSRTDVQIKEVLSVPS
jgi:hypothetical protein